MISRQSTGTRQRFEKRISVRFFRAARSAAALFATENRKLHFLTIFDGNSCIKCGYLSTVFPAKILSMLTACRQHEKSKLCEKRRENHVIHHLVPHYGICHAGTCVHHRRLRILQNQGYHRVYSHGRYPVSDLRRHFAYSSARSGADQLHGADHRRDRSGFGADQPRLHLQALRLCAGVAHRSGRLGRHGGLRHRLHDPRLRPLRPRDGLCLRRASRRRHRRRYDLHRGRHGCRT